MAANYPLLLSPHLAERVWGGTLLGDGIGEAWDLSVHPNGPNTIANGALAGRTLAEVAAENPDDFGGPIDLLAKRLDCAQDLSIQVHPKTGDPKTEAWIVLEAKPGAGVYHGWSRTSVDEEQARRAAIDGTLPELLRFLEVAPGQAVFVPSGTVHAIGGGLLLFELQQSADTTYRLFDWGRGRELHLEQGLGCSDWTNTEALPAPRTLGDGLVRLVECEHFFVDRLDTRKPALIDPGARWAAILMLEGSARVDDVALEPGATLMIPRAAGARTLAPSPACTALVYGAGAG